MICLTSTEFGTLNAAVSVTKDLRKTYFAHLEKLLDVKALKKAKLKIAVDPLFGTAKNYFRDFLEKYGITVEGIHEGLLPFVNVHLLIKCFIVLLFVRGLSSRP